MRLWKTRCITPIRRIQHAYGTRFNHITFNKTFKYTIPRVCFSTSITDVDSKSSDALDEDHVETFDFVPSNFDSYASFDEPVDPDIKYSDKEKRSILSAFKDLQTKNLMLQLQELDSLDSVLRGIAQMIISNGSALEPDHYAHCIRVLYKHADCSKGSGKHSLATDQIDNYCNVLMAVWTSSVALGKWQLSMTSYGCLIYLLAHFNHHGAFEIYYALQKIDTVILDDSAHGALMAMAYRMQEYERVIEMWQGMNKRYSTLRRTFNKSEAVLKSEWQWTDEKQREFHYLMADIPCQQMWMYHCALQAAENLQRTRTTSLIFGALFRWEQKYVIAQKKIMNPDLIESNDEPSIMNESVFTNQLVVRPVRTAVTYRLLLVHLSQAGDRTALLQALEQMEQQNILLTEKMMFPVVTLLSSDQQYEMIYALMCYVEQRFVLLEPEIVAPAILLMMKREHFERENLGVRFADASRQHIVRILTSFFKRCARNGRAELVTTSDDSNLMIVHAKDKEEEKPRNMLLLALLQASFMSEGSQSPVHLWIDTEEYFSMGVIFSTLTTLGARALRLEDCEPNVVESLKSMVPIHSKHIVYISPSQVHAFRTKLLQSFSSEPHLDQSTMQYYLESRVSSRYHSFWSDLAQSPPHTLPIIFQDFVKIWSLHRSPTLLMKSILSSSPYIMHNRFGFDTYRISRINNAVSSLCCQKILYLPSHMTVDFHQAVDPNAPGVDASLLNLTGQSVSNAYAATYIFLEYIAQLARSGVDRFGALYLRSDSLIQLEAVRMLIERYTTLIPLYLLRPTSDELRDAGSQNVPVNMVQGHPNRFRKLLRAMTLTNFRPPKNDLKYVLLVSDEQLEQQDRVIVVDPVHMGLDIAKQFDREQSELSNATQTVNNHLNQQQKSSSVTRNVK